tara:strand:+ start:441 stop:893 length:453 start_codon:yes stop_codon:yes gene_type:complete
MANSIRENILAKVKTQLETITDIGTVQRTRVKPIGNDVAFPAIFIYEDKEDININSPASQGKVVKNLGLTLQVWQIDDGSGLSTQLNSIIKDVEKAFMNDPQWDNLAMQTIPIGTRNFIEFNSARGEGYLGFEFDVEIQYRHTFYDPETA